MDGRWARGLCGALLALATPTAAEGPHIRIELTT